MCLLLLNTFHSFLSLPHDRSETPSFWADPEPASNSNWFFISQHC
jgi:hypothetical protein